MVQCLSEVGQDCKLLFQRYSNKMFSDAKLTCPSDSSFVGSFVKISTVSFEIAHDLFIKI